MFPARWCSVTLLPPASCSTQQSFGIPDWRNAGHSTNLSGRVSPAALVPPGMPKECLCMIRNVRTMRCQGAGGGAEGLVFGSGCSEEGQLRTFTKPLLFAYSPFIEGGFSLRKRILRRNRGATTGARPHLDGRWEAPMPMDSLHLESLWLIPLALAVSFLMWVIWNIEKDIRRQSRQ